MRMQFSRKGSVRTQGYKYLTSYAGVRIAHNIWGLVLQQYDIVQGECRPRVCFSKTT